MEPLDLIEVLGATEVTANTAYRELLLAALEADRREAVGRERALVRRGAGDKAIVYEQGIADGLRRALAIVETVLP